MFKKLDYEKKATYGFILSIIIAIVIYAYFQTKKFDQIEANGIEFVAKFTRYKRYPKSKTYYFEFYYLNKKKEMELNRAPDGFIYKVGKFYKIKYLPKYPDLFIVDFEKEVTNNEEILKAGFEE